MCNSLNYYKTEYIHFSDILLLLNTKSQLILFSNKVIEEYFKYSIYLNKLYNTKMLLTCCT